MIIFLTIFIIGLLVFVHELGHFACAKACRLPVKRFSLGFGPSLWSFNRNNVEYRISWFPLGGYVLLDMDDESIYLGQPLKKRIIFALGGPLTNLLVAIPLFALLNTLTHGFSLNGLFWAPFSQTYYSLVSIAQGFSTLFSQPDQLSGVVGMVSQGSRFVGMGLVKATSFSILISLNLAIFNLLPLPPLDGGRILLDCLHRINQKMVKVYMPLTIGGWVLILALMVYATTMDVGRMMATLNLAAVFTV